ncbi:RNA polymerase sigma factor [Flavobacterium algicola]|uniref:RNA polymerase sigma factor n=1 Tax=Flavobacterium algicola TaxID=556529 RepID=UPI001EFE7006|nr:RNA polymerase sigma-70 factor [Flavobacterium algicola]MCG9792399.1 RNA polymerase sigma-70 factor [Flavobacterium algicola]
MKSCYKNSSIEELQDFLKEGNEDAFNEIYNRLWKRLYCYAYRIFNDETSCEDIVQEVFIKLWEKAPSADINNIEAYLFTAIKYRIATHIRDLKFTSIHLDVLQNHPELGSFEKQMEYQEFERSVLSEIDKLSPQCKKVFQLSRFENISNNEIALMLNISIRTVEKHISDALNKLKHTITPPLVLSWIMIMFP